MPRQVPLQYLCAFTAACGAAPSPDAVLPEAPKLQTVISRMGTDAVTFTVDDVWVPDDGPGFIVLSRRDSAVLAVSVIVEPAVPGSTIQDQTVRWARRLLSSPLPFQATRVSNMDFQSEEGSVFTYEGIDGALPMVSKCRIRLLGASASDYWVTVISTSSAGLEAQAFEAVDEIVRNLRLHTDLPLP